jgi:hypothetical protein
MPLRSKYSPVLHGDFMATPATEVVEAPVDLEPRPVDDAAMAEATSEPFVVPSWLAGICQNLGSEAHRPFVRLGELEGWLLRTLSEQAAAASGFAPSAADLQGVLRPHVASGPVADAWVTEIAEKASESILAIRESQSEAARRRIAWEAERQAEEAAEKERQERLAFGEWARAEEIRQEFETKKWAAYESQQAAYEAWKARQGG